MFVIVDEIMNLAEKSTFSKYFKTNLLDKFIQVVKIHALKIISDPFDDENLRKEGPRPDDQFQIDDREAVSKIEVELDDKESLFEGEEEVEVDAFVGDLIYDLYLVGYFVERFYVGFGLFCLFS